MRALLLAASLLILGRVESRTDYEIRQALADSDLLVVTVASHETDGYKRFRRSLDEFGFLEDQVNVLGLGEPWKGGDMTSTGGGYKIRLLREALEQYKDRDDLIILFTDSYDVIVNGERDVILRRFFSDFDDARVVFSAEGFCWPDKSLAVKYPIVKSGKRYLCSGMFLGHAPDLYAMLTADDVKDTDDDQLYYTRLFLDQEFRAKHAIQLDSNSKLMQNLHGATDDVVLQLTAPHGIAEVHNVAYNTRPLLVHGNGVEQSKRRLDELGNYIGKAWSLEDGCIQCRENLRSLDGTLPLLTLSISIAKATPFLEEFLQRLADQDYPKERIRLHLHNTQTRHAEEVTAFLKTYESDYSDVQTILPSSNTEIRKGVRKAMEYCLEDQDCEYVFLIQSEAQLDNPLVLKGLIAQNRPILAPALTRPGKLWSNFWGAVNEDGFYARSEDYLDIVQGHRKGVWNMPYISEAMLVQRERLDALKEAFDYAPELDADMSFAKYCRDKGHFMMVDNLALWGHLVNADGYRTDRFKPDMYELFNNRLDWDLRYIHPKYSHYLKEDVKLPEPCPDVYDFPFLSPRMCKDLIAEMENNGEWSNGNNADDRLAGGYENVPTRDIHMNQISYEREWLQILQDYVRPIQEKVYTGYYHNPVHSIMNFVVRYKPEEQPSLRPHHDSSTYTIDVSLNEHGQDYEGGGVRYIRYNCSVTGHPVGWSVIMPGRLTHLHEGLETTKGTRYIAISFINP